jgi:mono/diheme cytochrome c family protein
MDLDQFTPFVLVATFSMLLAVQCLAATSDATAALYRSRCAACHGGKGESNTPMARKANIPSFASEAVRNLSGAEVEDFILFGGKERLASHTYFYKGISRNEGSQLAVYVKDLGSGK